MTTSPAPETALGAAVLEPPVAQPIATANPFVGPRPFERNEPLFGRERELSELYYRLDAERIVLLHSPAGAGKSSLLQAGLLGLASASFDVLGPTRVHLDPGAARAGRNRYVLSALMGFEENVPAAHRRPLEALAAQSLPEYLERRPRRRSAPPNVLVIVDQFEEILSVDPLAIAEKEAFFDQLGELLRQPRIWALFAMREDYLARLDPYRKRVPTHLNNRFRLELLGHDAARRAIAEPARLGGREFPAVDQLIGDLATVNVQLPDGSFRAEQGPFVEPMHLQVVCSRLWMALPAEKRSIEAADLETFGDVDEALGAFYDTAVAKVAGGDGGRERAIRDFFDRQLIRGGGGSSGPSQHSLRSQVLRERSQSGGLDNTLIEALLRTHLIRAESRAGAVWYELSHDRLLDPVIQRNEAWRGQRLSLLQQRAELWERLKKPEGLLFRGTDLDDAERWAEAHPREVAEVEGNFLSAARKARRQRRGRLALEIVATVLGVAALVLWIWADRQREKARHGLARAHLNEARRLSEAGETRKALAYHALFLRDPDNSAARGWTTDLLLRAVEPIASEPLRHASSPLSARFLPGNRLAIAAESELVLWDTEVGTQLRSISWPWVARAGFSADGRWALTGPIGDRPATWWSVEQGKKIGEISANHVGFAGDSWIVAREDSGDVAVLAAIDGRRIATLRAGLPRTEGLFVLSPDGRWAATSAEGKTLLWSVAKPERPITLPAGKVRSLAFRYDGGVLATATQGGVVRIWRTPDGEPATPPLVHDQKVEVLLFEPAGQRLVTSTLDGKVQLWDSRDGRPIGEPLRHPDVVFQATFSEDGGRLLTLARDLAVRVWILGTGQLARPPIREPGLTLAPALSGDGRRVAILSYDRSARIFDVSAANPAQILPHGSVEVRAGAFDPEGRRVATVAGDGGLRLWAADSGALLGEDLLPSSLLRVAFSGDGRWLAAAILDGTAVLYDLEALGEGPAMKGKRLPAGELNAPTRLAFSPDGQWLATAAAEAVRFWSLPGGEPAGETIVPRGIVHEIAFSPDSETLATATSDKSTQLWSVPYGAAIHQLEHESQLSCVGFSPDGRWLATGTLDGAVRVWNVATGTLQGAESRHGLRVSSVEFSPDSRLLVSASSDHTAQVWDVERGREVGERMRHDGPVTSAQFTRGPGRRIVTASDDGGVRLWESATGQPMSSALRHGGPVTLALFSPDGTRVLSTSKDGFARIWDVLLGKVDDADDLAELAMVAGGYQVDEFGTLAPIPAAERRVRLDALRGLARAAPEHGLSVATLARWYFTPREKRSLAPLSTMGMEEYLRRLAEVGSADARREGQESFPGHLPPG